MWYPNFPGCFHGYFQSSNLILLGAHWRVKQSSATKKHTGIHRGKYYQPVGFQKDTTSSYPASSTASQPSNQPFPFSLAVRWTNLLEAQVWAAQRPRYYWHLKLISRMTTGGKKRHITKHNDMYCMGWLLRVLLVSMAESIHEDQLGWWEQDFCNTIVLNTAAFRIFPQPFRHLSGHCPCWRWCSVQADGQGQKD